MTDLQPPLKQTTSFLPNRTKATRDKPILNLQGRTLPQALELEQAVLGALIIDREALPRVLEILKPDLFSLQANRLVYEAVAALFEQGEAIDILTVTQQLRRHGTLDQLPGGAYYLTELTGQVASAANLEFHARIVAQKYLQRELVRVCEEVKFQALDDTHDVFDLLNEAEQQLYSLSWNQLRRDSLPASSLVPQTIRELEEIQKREGGVTGVPSGFRNLDELTGGWQKSDLIIVAARPAMGKTAFMLSLARNAAIRYQTPVALFSLEMSSQQIAQRLLSAETELDMNKLRKGDLAQHEWVQLQSRSAELSRAPLFINDTPAISIYDLRTKCRRLKAEHGIGMIMVDYLQLMSAGAQRMGNREQEISAISRSLKELAKELNVAVIALSQLSRAVETRSVGGDKRPQLSDLRESGAIEQDADVVMFLYRPEYYKIEQFDDGTSTQGVAEVIVGKQRNGPTDSVRMGFVGRYAKFAELDAGMGSFRPLPRPEGGADTPFRPLPGPDPGSGPQMRTFPSRMNDLPDSLEDTFEAPF